MSRDPNFFSNTEAGYIQVLALTLLPLFLLSLVAAAALALRAQDRLALWFRLDVCAVRVADQRLRTLRSLRATNAQMSVLRKTIYVARGAKAVPGVGVAAGVSEKLALAANETLARAEDLLLATARAEELTNNVCGADKFSRTLASCEFTSLPPTQREETLFRDITGEVKLGPLGNFTVHCQSFLSGSETSLRLVRKGEDYAYEYLH